MNEENKKLSDLKRELLDGLTVSVQDFCKEHKLTANEAHELIVGDESITEKSHLILAAMAGYLNHIEYRKTMGKKD